MTTWTTDRPKVEGIYWMQRPGEPARVVMAHVVWGRFPVVLGYIGIGDQLGLVCPSGTLWYGPIVAPAMTEKWNCGCGARIAIACKCAIFRMPI